MATTIVSKMPIDWHEQGLNMVYIIAYLMKIIQFLHALWLRISKLKSILFQLLEKEPRKTKVQNTFKF